MEENLLTARAPKPCTRSEAWLAFESALISKRINSFAHRRAVHDRAFMRVALRKDLVPYLVDVKVNARRVVLERLDGTLVSVIPPVNAGHHIADQYRIQANAAPVRAAAQKLALEKFANPMVDGTLAAFLKRCYGEPNYWNDRSLEELADYLGVELLVNELEVK